MSDVSQNIQEVNNGVSTIHNVALDVKGSAENLSNKVIELENLVSEFKV